MQIFTKKALLISALILVSACGVQTMTQDVTTAGKQKGGFLGLSEAAEVSVDTADAFKGIDEVIIGGFLVGFDTYKYNKSQAGGGLMGGGFGGKTTAKSTLKGVSHAQMQSITEAAYQDFVAELKSQGIKVASRSGLVASKDFADTRTYPNPYKNDTSGILKGGNTTYYFAPKALTPTRIFMGDIMDVSGGFAFGNASMGASTYAEKNGAKILHVVLHVNFVNADEQGGWASTSSTIKVGQGLSVSPASHVGVIGGQGGTFSTNIGSITIGQPITSDKKFADVEESTTGTMKTVTAVTNVAGLLGGIGTNHSRDYNFNANASQYRAAVLDAIKDANDVFVGKMAELK